MYGDVTSPKEVGEILERLLKRTLIGCKAGK